MDRNFDVQSYMTRGVERLVADALKATLKNPRESAFMVKFAAASGAASKKRAELEKNGEHVPPFLIASITSTCNLHCAGCYSRCNHATVDAKPVVQLTGDEWLRIFREAEELGISFILLAGGEPMLRRDIIEAAGKLRNILFPIFTNGTFVDDKYLTLFDQARNLVPIMSIEGNRKVTDARRGKGVYDRLISNMEAFQKRGLIFGASVTVTTDNLKEVSSDSFIGSLSSRGCKAVIFVEFVPVTGESEGLAPGDKERKELAPGEEKGKGAVTGEEKSKGLASGEEESQVPVPEEEEGKKLAPGEEEREYLANEIARLRRQYPEMVFVSFPGDEKSSGGCLAAGRGFFHINSHGGAEPCPFSPFSDVNVRDKSLREAMKSPLFTAIRSGDLLADDHRGGCVLYEKREQVQALLHSV